MGIKGHGVPPVRREPTAEERALRTRVAADLRAIQSTLSLPPSGIAALLRNPGDSYPVDGLVRLMLSQTQTPSARFAELATKRRAEVESQLQAGLQVTTIAGQYQRAFHVSPKQHIVTIVPESELAGAEYRQPDELATIVIASLAVPAEWIATCPECGRVFVRRNSRQRVCRRPDESGRYPCVLAQNRKRRQARRG